MQSNHFDLHNWPWNNSLKSLVLLKCNKTVSVTVTFQLIQKSFENLPESERIALGFSAKFTFFILGRRVASFAIVFHWTPLKKAFTLRQLRLYLVYWPMQIHSLRCSFCHSFITNSQELYKKLILNHEIYRINSFVLQEHVAHEKQLIGKLKRSFDWYRYFIPQMQKKRQQSWELNKISLFGKW